MKIYFSLLLVSVFSLVAPNVYAQPTLNFSTIPVGSKADELQKYQPLMDEISKDTGMLVNYVYVNNYDELINDMANGDIDIGYFGPKSYVKAAEKGAVAVAREVDPSGESGYHGLLLVKSSSPYKYLADLKGKRFSFTDPQSTSGSLLPTAFFAMSGIDPKVFFSSVTFSGGHNNSILNLLAGKVDLIATNTTDLGRGIAADKWESRDFRVVWKSVLLPGPVYAVRKTLEEPTKEKIQQALIGFNDKKSLHALNILKIIPTKDKDYDVIREMIKSADDAEAEDKSKEANSKSEEVKSKSK